MKGHRNPEKQKTCLSDLFTLGKGKKIDPNHPVFFFGGGEVQLLVFGSVHSEDSEHVEIG